MTGPSRTRAPRSPPPTRWPSPGATPTATRLTAPSRSPPADRGEGAAPGDHPGAARPILRRRSDRLLGDLDRLPGDCAGPVVRVTGPRDRDLPGALREPGH